MEGEKAFIGEAEQSDDITLMTISKRSEMQPCVLQVENKISQWPALRKALQDYGMCVGMEDRKLKKMILALEEAVVNIVNYSQAKTITMTLNTQPSALSPQSSTLSVTLSDDGIAFDPTAQAEVDTAAVIDQRQIGGLGIALLRQIADEVRYRRTEEGENELTIIKNIKLCNSTFNLKDKKPS